MNKTKTVSLYRHTQVGYVILAATGAALLFILFIMLLADSNWISLLVVVILAASLWLFASLTVTVGGGELEVRFGPGLIRRRFRLRAIESCQVVRNQWYYGWGIRLTPGGWLYNVSGLDAVEIKMTSGKRYRIGTDEPAVLETAINQALRR